MYLCTRKNLKLIDDFLLILQSILFSFLHAFIFYKKHKQESLPEGIFFFRSSHVIWITNPMIQERAFLSKESTCKTYCLPQLFSSDDDRGNRRHVCFMPPPDLDSKTQYYRCKSAKYSILHMLNWTQSETLHYGTAVLVFKINILFRWLSLGMPDARAKWAVSKLKA